MPRISARLHRNRWPNLFGKSSLKLASKSRITYKSKPLLIIGSVLVFFIVSVFIVKAIWHNYTHSIWRGQGQATFAFEQQNKIGYIKINTDLNEAVVLTFPDNAVISLSNGYQDYRADKVKLLAQQEKANFGDLLSKSMTQFLGSVTDGYIVNAHSEQIDIVGLLWQALLCRAETNFSSWDIVRLLYYAANLRSDQVKFIDMSNTDVFHATTLPDKSQVYVAESEAMDTFGLMELARLKYLQEPLTWEIFNGTEHTGMGLMMKRMVANSGFDVTGVRQARQPYERSVIIVKPAVRNNQYVADFARYFQLPITAEGEKSASADVTVILGEDFWQSCCVRR